MEGFLEPDAPVEEEVELEVALELLGSSGSAVTGPLHSVELEIEVGAEAGEKVC